MIREFFPSWKRFRVKWIETKVVFEGDQQPLDVELVAGAFYDQGVCGVVIDDPGLEPAEGWGDGIASRPKRHAVSGYFADTPAAAVKRRRLEEQLERLSRDRCMALQVGHRIVDEEDWAEAWKAFFWPQKITDTIVVKPTWRHFRPRADEIVIEIDPGMAFGTGTHPTTALCVAMLQKYLGTGDRFLDIGTGSGILMAAAAKLGAGRMTGVDNDEVAVAVARKNLRLNGVTAERFDLVTGDLTAGVQGPFDVVTANILTDVILRLLDQIGLLLAPRAIFIASGITQENQERVIAKMARRQLPPIETAVREQWMAVVGRRE
jgi:ribosomal protein L11 methyltransferase